MKLSFSTKGWHGYSFESFCNAAQSFGFGGIELHNIHGSLFAKQGEAFFGANARTTVRSLYEKGLSVPCIDAVCDLCDEKQTEAAVSEIDACLDIASRLHIPYVRLRACGNGCDTDTVYGVVKSVIADAEAKGICLLIQTCGAYSDTAVLRDLLNRFSSDAVGALWDAEQTIYRGECAEDTVRNLGAYIRHVHMRDSVRAEDGQVTPCLIGEGALPVPEIMQALRSVNYEGFISLVWDPEWLPEIPDMETVFSHFAAYMRRYDKPEHSTDSLYYNRTHTGKYIWKKDLLIEATFSQVLDRMAEEFPDQYAFKYTTLDYTRTYSEFRDDVDEFARVLVSLGVKAGSHVAVWATNIPQWYITFWATVKIGAVLVTMNTAYKIAEAEYLLRQSDTHTIVMIDGYRDSDYRAVIDELCPELRTATAGEPLHCSRLPFLRNVITVGFGMPGCLTWEKALLRASKVSREQINRMAAAVKPSDVCNMQYTSGTTGFPKGVMLTHRNVVNNGKCIGDRMDLSTADRMMIHVPMFHCFGMVLAMTASMTHGASLYPLPYFSPKPSLACINSEHITAFHGVPTMFIAMLEHPDFAKTDFSYMRTGIMAGSPCPIAIMRDVVDKMHMNEIVIVYGQTEASPGCTMSSTDDPLEVRVSTVGRAMPEIECKIVDPETGADLPDGATGEFVARGYNIMKGYYKMPKATAAAIDSDGWLHTGDLACRQSDGNFRITGRLKDMIIRGGENIYPKEIEEFIYTHPKVKDVQVIGVPDEQYGEEIMACIIVKDGQSMTADEMKAYVNSHMARHKVPRYIDFVDSFPMNVAGKILKYQMRADAIKKLGLQKAAHIVTA